MKPWAFFNEAVRSQTFQRLSVVNVGNRQLKSVTVSQRDRNDAAAKSPAAVAANPQRAAAWDEFGRKISVRSIPDGLF